MEDQLSNVLILSLKEIALRRVAVILWNGPDISDAIGKYLRKTLVHEEKDWQEAVESKVTDKMLKLGLPESLVKQIACFPIGLQIRRWKNFHSDYLNEPLGEFDMPIVAKLFWTTLGAIDYKRSAEDFIRCDEFGIEKRYRVACLYCLEDYIRVLWEELPEDRKHFYNDTWKEPRLQFWWPKLIKGENSNFDAFAYSACKGYKTATEYFFQKLTDVERESALIRVARDLLADSGFKHFFIFECWKNRQISDVLYYLLSLMTHEQQMQIFKEQPRQVLIRFLFWPWQDVFLKIADLVWDFLTPKDYDDLLSMTAKCYTNFENYYTKFFQKFFLRTPRDFKKRFVDRELDLYFFKEYQFLCKFFDSEDSESIEIIFRNVDDSDKVKLVSSAQFFTLLCSSYSKGSFGMVELCLREATPALEDRREMKKCFMEFLKKRDRGALKKSETIWNRLLRVLYEIDASGQSKRGSEDATLPAPKKVCLEE